MFIVIWIKKDLPARVLQSLSSSLELSVHCWMSFIRVFSRFSFEFYLGSRCTTLWSDFPRPSLQTNLKGSAILHLSSVRSVKACDNVHVGAARFVQSRTVTKMWEPQQMLRSVSLFKYALYNEDTSGPLFDRTVPTHITVHSLPVCVCACVHTLICVCLCVCLCVSSSVCSKEHNPPTPRNAHIRYFSSYVGLINTN